MKTTTRSHAAPRRLLVTAMTALALGGAAVCSGISPVQAQTTGESTEPMVEMDPSQLPGRAMLALESMRILESAAPEGREVVVNRTVRAPGTRTPIHYHDEGGTTCVLEGEMTLYLADQPPQRAVAGECYFMPPNLPMTGVNTGAMTAVLLDIFMVKAGAPVWRVVEEGQQEIQKQFNRPSE